MRFLSIAAIVAIALTVVCGLWMRWGPGEKDAGFHAALSLGTLALCLVTIVLSLTRTGQ